MHAPCGETRGDGTTDLVTLTAHQNDFWGGGGGPEGKSKSRRPTDLNYVFGDRFRPAGRHDLLEGAVGGDLDA